MSVLSMDNRTRGLLSSLAKLDRSIARIEHNISTLEKTEISKSITSSQTQALVNMPDLLLQEQLAVSRMDQRINKATKELQVMAQRIDEVDAALVAEHTPAQQAELHHEGRALERRHIALAEQIAQLQLELKKIHTIAQHKRQDQVKGLAQKELSEQNRLDSLTSAQEELAAMQKTRQEILSRIAEPIVQKYQQIAVHKKNPLGFLRGDMCTACGIQYDHDALLHIKNQIGKSLTLCPECGSILIQVEN